MTRIVALALIAVLWTAPAHAQWVVFDPANVAQAILIVERNPPPVRPIARTVSSGRGDEPAVARRDGPLSDTADPALGS